MVKFLSLLLLGVGVFTLSQAAFPLAAYKLWEVTNLKSNLPLMEPLKNSSDVLGISVQNLSNNFPALVSSLHRELPEPYDSFLLSIPKLKIDQAKVLVDSNDIDAGLSQLPGSSLPGEKGNVFISGHSNVLFSLNAQSIFTNLIKLEKGDEVTIAALGQTFKYKIIGMKIVDPKDTSVVNPPDEFGRYLSLMTCVPPGINTKRLVVIGKLE